MAEKRVYFNKAEYKIFQQWVKHNDWLFIKREGVWSAIDSPKLLYWLEIWLCPSGLVIKIERESDK